MERQLPAGGQHAATLMVDRTATLLAGCASVRHASKLHAAAARAGVDHDKAVDFRLQRAYAASGRLDLSVALLWHGPDPTAVFYTSYGLHLPALALLSDMLSRDLLPTAHTLSASLPACCSSGLALHGYAVELALSSDPNVATALLSMYMRSGDPEPHVVSVTAILTCYAKMGTLDDHGRPNEVLWLFRRILRSDVEPDEVSVVLALSTVAQLDMTEYGRWLAFWLEGSGAGGGG
ncbi:hypothetical protein SETIT_4G260600v2 [Setaria italica]|uniref:Pentacotripeptide-repeat region of PRORP domain-containing protein n=1 Tax=Setaria italica TaxID=4555 RepID=K3Y1L3_SETIT|nr:hypothetical protein SETIT_4G260600v2 [Setaria italica]